jgi:hypothetical protein
MSDSQNSASNLDDATREEQLSALFAHLVMQQANMALMLLGKVPHPETGKLVKDTDAARLFIEQLEMLEAKTRGNLTKDEANLLKQSLMSVQLAFVQAVEAPEPTASTSQPEAKSEDGPATAASPAAEEPQKKFSKKY